MHAASYCEKYSAKLAIVTIIVAIRPKRKTLQKIFALFSFFDVCNANRKCKSGTPKKTKTIDAIIILITCTDKFSPYIDKITADRIR